MSVRPLLLPRIALAILIMAFLPAARVAAQDAHLAGLVVDYGDGRMTFAVIPFAEDQINGIDLLDRSGLDVVTVGFGGLGDAVCQVDDTGCPVGDCRTRLCQTSDPDSPFWQFSKLDGEEWRFVATGASGAVVRDGDIYAWSWTGTPPELPLLTMSELIERAGGDPARDLPEALLRTEGQPAGKEEEGDWLSREPLAAAGLGAVGVLAVIFVLRSRRLARTADDR